MSFQQIIGSLVVFAGVCGVACGEPLDGDLGQLEQQYSARFTSNYQLGVRPTSTGRQCDRVSSGQVCSVPLHKTIEVITSYTPTFQESANLFTLRQQYDDASNFSYPFAISTDPPAPNSTRLFITKGAIGGTGTNAITDYARVTTYGSPNALTEGVVDGDPVGNYQTHGYCICTFDAADIEAKTSDPTERSRLQKHAFAVCFSECSGLGLKAEASGAYSQTTINLTSNLSVLTPGEACRMNSYNNTANGDFSNQSIGGFCSTGD